MFRKIIMPIVLVLAIALFICFMSGMSNVFGTFFDFTAFVAIVLPPFLLTSLGFGIKKTKLAYSAPFSSDADAADQKTAIAYFNAVLAYMLSLAGLSLAIGFVGIMINLAEASALLGPKVALTILSIFYGALGSLLFVLPFRTAALARLSVLEA